MKKINLLTVAVLASTMVGGAVVSAAEVSNAPQKIDTTAHVKFIQDDEPGQTPENPTDPEGGGVIEPGTPGGNTPSEKAPLMINFAPNFEFGEVKIQSTDISVPAINEIKSTEGNDIAHFAQVSDNRGTHEGWNLSLTTTAFNTVDGTADTKLSDANISLENVKAEGNSEGKATTEASQTIKFPQTAVTVMKAAANTGEGSWTAKFGSNDSLTQGEDNVLNTNVKLNISAKDMAKVSATDYTATLTWNLTGNTSKTASATPAV